MGDSYTPTSSAPTSASESKDAERLAKPFVQDLGRLHQSQPGKEIPTNPLASVVVGEATTTRKRNSGHGISGEWSLALGEEKLIAVDAQSGRSLESLRREDVLQQDILNESRAGEPKMSPKRGDYATSHQQMASASFQCSALGLTSALPLPALNDLTTDMVNKNAFICCDNNGPERRGVFDEAWTGMETQIRMTRH